MPFADDAGSLADPSLLDFGDRLVRWLRKCLQVAVLSLCGCSLRAVVRKRLVSGCSNSYGSGFAAGVPERRNFNCVEQTLRSVGKCVHVVDVERVADVWAGGLLGVSCLGAVHGASLGVLVWARSEQHVYGVEHDDAQAWRRAVSLHVGVGRVPWTVSTVGAPKKKRGFRGGDPSAAGKKSGASRTAGRSASLADEAVAGECLGELPSAVVASPNTAEDVQAEEAREASESVPDPIADLSARLGRLRQEMEAPPPCDASGESGDESERSFGMGECPPGAEFLCDPDAFDSGDLWDGLVEDRFGDVGRPEDSSAAGLSISERLKKLSDRLAVEVQEGVHPSGDGLA